MARVVLRVTIGLVMVLAAGLLVAPFLWSTDAQARTPATARAPQTTPSTFPTITTTASTSPPSSSSVSTTPTTKKSSSTTRPRSGATTTSTTGAPTTTTSTTVAPIPAAAPPPVTLPLASASQSGSISAFFPILSGLGLVTLVGLLAAQWFLTKPGRKGPTL